MIRSHSFEVAFEIILLYNDDILAPSSEIEPKILKTMRLKPFWIELNFSFNFFLNGLSFNIWTNLIMVHVILLNFPRLFSCSIMRKLNLLLFYILGKEFGGSGIAGVIKFVSRQWVIVFEKWNWYKIPFGFSHNSIVMIFWLPLLRSNPKC